jgi:predicted ATP-grasp superfamily ATP-dependent carboligase
MADHPQKCGTVHALKFQRGRPCSYSVLIPDGEHPISWNVVGGLSRIKGIKIHVASKTRDTDLRFSRHLTSFHVGPDLTDEERYRNWLLDLAEETGATLLMPISAPLVRFCALHRDALAGRVRLPLLPDLATFESVFDKGNLSRLLERLDIPHPPTLRCDDHPGLASALGDFSFPALLKPCRGAGGWGIQRFDTREVFLKRLQQEPRLAAGCVLQTFVPGLDMGCSVLCKDGDVLARTVQYIPRVTEGSFAPQLTRIGFVHDEAAFETTSRLVRGTRWNGVANVDLRRDSRTGEVKLLEVNPRFWGSVGASVRAGVNFPALSCRAGYGERFDPPGYPDHVYLALGEAVRQFVENAKHLKLRTPGLPVRTPAPFVLRDPAPSVRCWFNKARAGLVRRLSRAGG